MKNATSGDLPLFIPHSNTSTAVNKTGSWRFFHPKYEEKSAPCSKACPLGQDIPRIEMLASRNLLKDAWQTILDENPFPSVCGRVCFHPCESVCNRNNLDESIAIHKLERFLGDTSLSQGKKPELNILSAKKQKVAIVGAGPAGLSAAYFLTKLGYSCAIFEAGSAPGGLLRQGIPAYRLSRNILEREIGRIEALGVTIHCNTPVAAPLLEKLQSKYDALFIGSGYGSPISLNIEGGHLALDGLDFLRRLHRGEKMAFRGRAAVIGGGNTAIDVARSLARLGAEPMIVYRRRLEDMPAFEPELKMALEEGLDIMELTIPVHIRKNHGNRSSQHNGYTLTLQNMKVGKKEADGRARVIPDGDKTKTTTVHHIFSAIGAEAEALWNYPKTDNPRTLRLTHCKFTEKEIPILVGGDLTNPIKSVADAVASGKQAAIALNTYFEHSLKAVESEIAACRVGGGSAISMEMYLGGGRLSRKSHVVTYDEIVSDYFQSTPRVMPPVIGRDQRLQSFVEVESTLDRKAAIEEAARCFNCGICSSCDFCRIYCPEMAVNVNRTQRWIDMDYCKGCGVCATECPRNAMALEEERK